MLEILDINIDELTPVYFFHKILTKDFKANFNCLSKNKKEGTICFRPDKILGICEITTLEDSKAEKSKKNGFIAEKYLTKKNNERRTRNTLLFFPSNILYKTNLLKKNEKKIGSTDVKNFVKNFNLYENKFFCKTKELFTKIRNMFLLFK